MGKTNVWKFGPRITIGDFNENGGWATVGRMNGNLADLADFAVSGNYSTPGFGSMEKRVAERQQEFIMDLTPQAPLN